MSDTATPAKPAKTKRKIRTIALRCIRGGGIWVFGDRYLAHAVHTGVNVTYFDIMTGGEMRTVPDDRFVPENLAHWWLFSVAQRLRFGPGAHDHHLAYPNANRRAA